MSTAPPVRATAAPLVLSKIATVRRDNLRTLCEVNGSAAALSKKLGYRSASFMSQMIGPNPTREVTEKSAREFEARLALPAGSMDIEGWDGRSPAAQQVPPAGSTSPATPPPADGAAPNYGVVADVIRVIGAVSASEGVSVPPVKFPDLVALGFADSMEHGGVPRENYIKQLVQLLK